MGNGISHQKAQHLANALLHNKVTEHHFPFVFRYYLLINFLRRLLHLTSG